MLRQARLKTAHNSLSPGRATPPLYWYRRERSQGHTQFPNTVPAQSSEHLSLAPQRTPIPQGMASAQSVRERTDSA